MLRRLLRKPSPEQYTISLPEEEQKNYDFISVLGETTDHTGAYIQSWDEENDIVHYMWWPEGVGGVRGTDAECAFTDIKWDTLNVRHRYRTWGIKYGKVSEAYWHDILRVPWWKWWLQKFRNRFLVPVRPDYRMRLLKQIVDMHSQQMTITQEDLLVWIHGTTIRLSNDYHRHHKDVEFLLESLKESGDVILKDENNAAHFLGRGQILPAPQSARTIAEFNEDVTRHRDMVKLSKRHLWLGWAMFAIAAVTLFVELRKWLK